MRHRAVVFAEYFPPYMSSDRRLYHLVSNLSNWSVSAIVTPPLRVLTKRCEGALLPYGRKFERGVSQEMYGDMPLTYLSLPGWLRHLFEDPSTLPMAYAACIPLLVAEAARQVRDLDPDICVVGHPSFITGVVGVMAAKMNRKPILLDYPDAWTALAVETAGVRSKPTVAVLRQIEAWVARAADRIVVITDSLAGYVRNLGARVPIEVISNGAELDRFEPRAMPAAGNEARGPFRVLFAGRLESWSGVHEMADLVEAVVGRAGSRVEFRFVGDGGRAQAFRHQLESRGLLEHCVFDGFQPYGLMPELIASCDLALLLFPDTQTTRVSSPVKLFEYMAMGKPVLASNLPGVREAVGRGEAIIVDDLRSHQLADEVLRLIGSPEECARIGDAARQLVHTRYGWRHLAGLFENEMDRTLAAAREPSRVRQLASYPAAAASVPSANSVSPP